MSVRTDLNGRLLTRPQPPQIFYLIDQGQKRGIPPAAFPNFLDSSSELVITPVVDQIDSGPDWPTDVKLVGAIENSAIWLVENGKKRGIPSGQIMDWYHFARSKVIKMPVAQISATYPDGPQIDPPTHPLFPLSVSVAQDDMSLSVTISSSGIVEMTRSASITKESGVYHHFFWFSLVDVDQDAQWAMPSAYDLTIGAALNPLGQPVRVTKQDPVPIVFNIDPNLLTTVVQIVTVMQRTEDGNGSLLDQIQTADRIYTTLKNLESVKDLTKLVALELAAG